ncbi:hypothetical protein HAX54_018788 [Datura stramonium]|uniref:Uncharacterized protein n=1 Tax=Datura stramonium TaxID=4076 RepID=A0ABS8UN30_DATST|nr:hypothetical protein [Datura stramonium]
MEEIQNDCINWKIKPEGQWDMYTNKELGIGLKSVHMKLGFDPNSFCIPKEILQNSWQELRVDEKGYSSTKLFLSPSSGSTLETQSLENFQFFGSMSLTVLGCYSVCSHLFLGVEGRPPTKVPSMMTNGEVVEESETLIVGVDVSSIREEGLYLSVISGVGIKEGENK